MEFHPIFHKWPIEKVSIESGNDEGLNLLNMLHEFNQGGLLVRLIKDSDVCLVLFIGDVFEVFYVLGNHIPVNYEEPIPVNNIGNQDHLVER